MDDGDLGRLILAEYHTLERLERLLKFANALMQCRDRAVDTRNRRRLYPLPTVEFVARPGLLDQRFVDHVASIDDDRQDKFAALLTRHQRRKPSSAVPTMAWPHRINHRLADTRQRLARSDRADIVGGFLIHGGEEMRHYGTPFDAIWN